MIIHKEVIKKLNPCLDRFDNYIKHYGDRSFTPRQFMGLKKITHEDKLWVAVRLIAKYSIRLAAADIAESVLDIFESQYPNDSRPREAIEAARKKDITAAEITAAAAYVAAYAAYVATDVAFAYAAFSAAYAAHLAASTVYATDSAEAVNAAVLATYAATNAGNAAYAVASDAAYAADAASDAVDAAYAVAASASDAAAFAAGSQQAQEKKIRTILLRYLK